MNIELISTKRPMGRPPLPPGAKKVRLHISVEPSVADAAKRWKWGISDYFETLHKVKKNPKNS